MIPPASLPGLPGNPQQAHKDVQRTSICLIIPRLEPLSPRWPGQGPLVSPGAQTTQLFLKLGQQQAPGGWQGWEGLFSPAWELQNKGQTLWIPSFPRLRERPLTPAPGLDPAVPAVPDTPGTSPRGHRPLLPTPAAIPAAGKQHLPACLPACSRLAPASQLDFAPCTWKVRQCPRLELPAPHARPAQLPTPFSGVFKAAGGIVSFSCVKELELP